MRDDNNNRWKEDTRALALVVVALVAALAVAQSVLLALPPAWSVGLFFAALAVGLLAGLAAGVRHGSRS